MRVSFNGCYLLNRYYDLEKSPTIKDDIFQAFLAESYAKKANKIDFSNVTEPNLLAKSVFYS